jgi:hypothetical protein
MRKSVFTVGEVQIGLNRFDPQTTELVSRICQEKIPELLEPGGSGASKIQRLDLYYIRTFIEAVDFLAATRPGLQAILTWLAVVGLLLFGVGLIPSGYSMFFVLLALTMLVRTFTPWAVMKFRQKRGWTLPGLPGSGVVKIGIDSQWNDLGEVLEESVLQALRQALGKEDGSFPEKGDEQ